MAAGYKPQAQMGGWGHATPIADKDLPSWFTKPQGTDAGTHRIYQMMGMSGPDGRIITRNPDGGFTQHGGSSTPAPMGPRPMAPKPQPQPKPPQPEQPGAKPRPVGNQPNGSASPMNYQSGINVGGGIGKQGILSGLLDTGNQPNPNVSALSRGIAWNDASQIGRAIDAQNQDIRMQQQAKRSESTTEGASNMAKIAGDYAERGISQTNLAAQIAANNIGFAGGIAKLGGQWPTNPGAFGG
jgi:hypothetical protein